jgi:protein tyrosine phosphatase (PTP) superfamily phosphohydrolase (DUF442 family)
MPPKPLVKTLYFLPLFLLVFGCATQRGFPPQFGVTNLDRVDARIWRSGQPTRLGLESLQKQGVTEVLNLSLPGETWPGEKAACEALGMRYHALPLPGLSAPSVQQVEAALAIVRAAKGQILIHCQHGCDRTGTLIACHRIRENGWENAAALREAEAYGLSPLELGMRRFIRGFK